MVKTEGRGNEGEADGSMDFNHLKRLRDGLRECVRGLNENSETQKTCREKQIQLNTK